MSLVLTGHPLAETRPLLLETPSRSFAFFGVSLNLRAAFFVSGAAHGVQRCADGWHLISVFTAKCHFHPDLPVFWGLGGINGVY